MKLATLDDPTTKTNPHERNSSTQCPTTQWARPEQRKTARTQSAPRPHYNEPEHWPQDARPTTNAQHSARDQIPGRDEQQPRSTTKRLADPNPIQGMTPKRRRDIADSNPIQGMIPKQQDKRDRSQNGQRARAGLLGEQRSRTNRSNGPPGFPPTSLAVSWDRSVDAQQEHTDSASMRMSQQLNDRASERTMRRLTTKNRIDLSIIGEFPRPERPGIVSTKQYLPSDVQRILPNQIIGPDDFFEPDPEFLANILTIMSHRTPTPSAPPFRFGVSTTDLEHNLQIISKAGFDFNKLLPRHQKSTLGFGSEFRPIEDLALLLAKHPHFQFIVNILSHGMDYHFLEGRQLKESDRLVEMAGQLQRGNHKSVAQNVDKVRELLTKDVTHGFTIPFPIECAPQIKGAMIQPLGGREAMVAEREL